MITCTLGEKKYSVDFVTGRVLREIEPATKMYGRVSRIALKVENGEEVPQEEQVSVADALDVMAKWFCLLFGNQFTVDDLYDHYPADRLMSDIALALMAVQTSMTQVLSEFPTKPTAAETETEMETTKN